MKKIMLFVTLTIFLLSACQSQFEDYSSKQESDSIPIIVYKQPT